MYDKKLHLVVDMNGCPNRCRHCWLGHMPNRIMEEDADSFIMNCFYPYFEKIAYYSWLREPDYCDAYKERWERDKAISKNCEPERFELASFYRIVRDPTYIPFLRSVGVKRIQLTFFGLEETQGRYVGRKGAYEEIMKATGLLIEGGIIPRWQCFINEENKDEIVQLYEMAQNLRIEKCPELEFFVHEGTCEGENRKLYPIRICKKNIPEELIPVYLNYEEILSEKECVEILMNDDSHPEFPIGDEITLNISNTYDVYYNFTHMTGEWIIGNLKTDDTGELVNRIISGDTYALNKTKECTWPELVKSFGDKDSDRVFSLDDYKTYLFNTYLENSCMKK